MKRRLGILVFGVWLAMGGSAVAQQAPRPNVDKDPRLAQTLAICYQCHGENGVSSVPTRPIIAGQKPDYIVRQLRAFKHAAAERAALEDETSADGAGRNIARSDPVMDHMAAGLAESLIPKIAATIAGLRCDGGVKAEKKPIAPPPVVERCTVCHGADGISSQAHIPNLAGQHRAYLRRQLLLIRETAWGAAPREGEAWRSHPIMEAQAARLTIAGVDALAKYYAHLDCRGAGQP